MAAEDDLGPSMEEKLALIQKPSLVPEVTETKVKQMMSSSAANSIRVVVRFRPYNSREKVEDAARNYPSSPLEIESDGTVQAMSTIIGKQIMKDFKFDYALDLASQEDSFVAIAMPCVLTLLTGVNATIFVYGQTGAGKTWTMLGAGLHGSNVGLYPRTIWMIMYKLQQKQAQGIIEDFEVSLSFLEIYLEQLRDLMNPHSSKKLAVRERRNGDHFVQNLEERKIDNSEIAMEFLDEASANRTVSATAMNASSSRSHMVMAIKLTQWKDKDTKTLSELNFADLAGCEKLRKTGATGQQAKEGQKINLSLTQLGIVIQGLAYNASHKKKKYVSFRDSMLTQVLQDSLEGNCRTTLVINCSKALFNREETINTMEFGKRCKNLKTKAKKNTNLSPAAMRKKIKALEKKVKELEKQVADGSFKAAAIAQTEVVTASLTNNKSVHFSMAQLPAPSGSGSNDDGNDAGLGLHENVSQAQPIVLTHNDGSEELLSQGATRPPMNLVGTSAANIETVMLTDDHIETLTKVASTHLQQNLAHLEKLSQQLDEAEKALEEKDDDYEALKNEMESVENDYRQQRNIETFRYNTMRKSLTKKEDELEEVEGELAEKSREVLEMGEQTMAITASINEKNELIEKLTNEISLANTHKDMINSKVAELESANAGLEAQYQQAISALEEKGQETEEFLEAQKVANAHKTTLENQLREFRINMERSEGALSQLKTESVNVNKRNEELLETVGGLKFEMGLKIKELQESQEQWDNERTILHTEVNELSDEKTKIEVNFETMHRDKTQKIKELESALKTMEESFNEQAIFLDQLEQARMVATEAKEEVQTIKGLVKEKSRAFHMLEEQLNEQQQQLDEVNEAHNEEKDKLRQNFGKQAAEIAQAVENEVKEQLEREKEEELMKRLAEETRKHQQNVRDLLRQQEEEIMDLQNQLAVEEQEKMQAKNAKIVAEKLRGQAMKHEMNQKMEMLNTNEQMLNYFRDFTENADRAFAEELIREERLQEELWQEKRMRQEEKDRLMAERFAAEQNVRTEERRRFEELHHKPNVQREKAMTSEVRLNELVKCRDGTKGHVKFQGDIVSVGRPMVGIVISKGQGDSNGVIDGIRYFDCIPGKGKFILYEEITHVYRYVPSKGKEKKFRFKSRSELHLEHEYDDDAYSHHSDDASHSEARSPSSSHHSFKGPGGNLGVPGHGGGRMSKKITVTRQESIGILNEVLESLENPEDKDKVIKQFLRHHGGNAPVRR